MRWGSFLAVILVSVVILLFQWPKVKKAPKKDKWAFSIILIIGWTLSMFDLPHINGPVTWKEMIFKPLGQFLQK